ncbi:MAG: hypothetical protein ACI9FJ_003362 [Alteromonadaceae bacterium]|jgi:hypothetical protein
MLSVSRITDRFGNWVEYNWGYRRDCLATVNSGPMPRTETSLSLDYQHVLLSITANDGLTISLSGADNVTITAAGRSWQYRKKAIVQDPYGNIMRSNQYEVVLPDNSAFVFYEEFKRSDIIYAFVIEHPQGRLPVMTCENTPAVAVGCGRRLPKCRSMTTHGKSIPVMSHCPPASRWLTRQKTIRLRLNAIQSKR